MANSVLFGAIGVMVLKKTNSAMELYFAHNTESFVSDLVFFGKGLYTDHARQALASFTSNADKPRSLMSRGTRGTISQGASRIRFTKPRRDQNQY